jgi:membrane protein DedA with SNARE-associated domain
MNSSSHTHSFLLKLLWIVLTLGAVEGALLLYYLDSWLTLPLL